MRRSGETAQAFASLLAKAEAEGTVRVIIGLRVSAKPEGELPGPQAVQTQRTAIASARDALLDRLSAYNVTDVKEFEFIPFVAMQVDAAALRYLEASPGVISIEEDLPMPLALAQSVPLIGAPAMYAAGFAGAGQAIAVLDTGVDKFHSFLAGKVVSEACYSSTTSTSTSVCPGGVPQSTSPGSGVNCGTNGCDHGTHVAGIAAGQGASFTGVAKDSDVIAIQVFSRFDRPIDCIGSPTPCVKSYTSDQILGLQRVQALSGSLNIAAVNLSLGGGQYSSNCDASFASYKAAIDNLRSIGIATVIASGNNGYTNSMSFPACISTAISVGSTDDGSSGTTVDAVSNFSNSASFLHLLAPGRWINSSVPGGGFATFSGTSMAAPHVAGAWAILKQQTPAASVTQILSTLTSTGLPITDPRNGITKPRIRLDDATGVTGLQYYPLPNPVRLLDTRAGQVACDAPGTPLTGGATRTQAARIPCTGIPASAQVVVGNATVVNTGAGATDGYITLYPSGAPQPNASNLNYVAGQIVPNAFTVGLGSGDGAFQIFATSGTHFIVDVTGYYAPPGAGGLYYHPLPNPVRLLDTRAGQVACDAPGTPLAGGATRTEAARIPCTGIPAGALAVVGNATVVNTGAGAAGGYVTLYPSGASQPTVSNLNYVPGQIVPNAFTVGLGGGDGAFNIFATSGTHFIVDITGYYSTEATDVNGAGLLYNALPNPVRLLDTRPGQTACDAPGTPLAGGATRTEPARTVCSGIPSSALAVVGNATVVNTGAGAAGGYITLYPSGASQPTVSNLNYVAGQVVPNAFTVGLGAGDGAFNIFASSSTHFIADLTGYFAP